MGRGRVSTAVPQLSAMAAVSERVGGDHMGDDSVTKKRPQAWVGKWEGGRIALLSGGRRRWYLERRWQGRQMTLSLPGVRDDRAAMARLSAFQDDPAGFMERHRERKRRERGPVHDAEVLRQEHLDSLKAEQLNRASSPHATSTAARNTGSSGCVTSAARTYARSAGWRCRSCWPSTSWPGGRGGGVPTPAARQAPATGPGMAAAEGGLPAGSGGTSPRRLPPACLCESRPAWPLGLRDGELRQC